ncbi:MAG: DUF4012 domain-containing protein, partial [Acidimicrobiia bacterium]|nr:DUF4012 domain-containing protein [Acidimicrobiia bacterium]
MSPTPAASQLDSALPRTPEGVPGRRRTQRRTSTGQRHAVHTVVAASAVAAAVFTDARPTDLWLIDAMYRALFAGALAWIGSRTRRRMWPVLAGASVLLASSWLALFAGVGATAAAVTTVRGPRNRLAGAVVGGVAGLVLLDMHLPGPEYLETAVAASVVAPAAWSAWSVLPPPATRRIRRAATIVLGAVCASVALAVLAIVLAAGDLRTGVEASQKGLDAVRDGSVADARTQLDQAADDLGRASGWLTSPLAQPARLVPIAGQHVRAAQVTSAEASALTAAAADAASLVDTDRLRPIDGAVDLAAFDPAVAPLERLDLTVQRAITNLAAIESPWLLPPAAGPLAELRRGLDDIAPATEVAAVAARELPALLGREGTRDYLVLLTTPAEARGTGGFIGSWVIVRADQGRVTLAETGRASDINRALDNIDATLHAPLDYQARWARFDPAGHFQDITLSPDFPTVAGVAADLVRQTGRQVDGVMAVDPLGLEALLAFTGPVPVPGTEQVLNERNASSWLLTDQYE